jgi:hypothetical protein
MKQHPEGRFDGNVRSWRGSILGTSIVRSAIAKRRIESAVVRFSTGFYAGG